MSEPAHDGPSFFERPIVNSPYTCPTRYWELDAQGQPTQQLVENRRPAEFITPIPKPKKQKRNATPSLPGIDPTGLSTADQEYDPTSLINQVRSCVSRWRALPNPELWRVTPETARLLQHWRHHAFTDVRPFFCQVEAVETAIWLSEVAPHDATGKRLLDSMHPVNHVLD